MIERKLYIDRIKPFIGQGLIKVLIGQRRVGKTYILRLIADVIKKQNAQAHIVFIDKEDYAFESLVTHEQLFAYIENHKSNAQNYLFIDEVQEIEGFEKVLRHYIKQADFDIYITGSNAKMFSGELATLLSGRQLLVPIGSLSFLEFCQFHQLEPIDTALQKYMRYGGLPYLMHLPDDEAIRFEYLKNIFDTILLRDVIQRNQIRDPRFLTDLLKFLADVTGSLFSANKIAQYLKSQQIKKNVALILSYLSYIAEAYFINAVGRIDVQCKKQFEVGEKYYFEDIGLRNAIVGFRMQDIEKVMENLVYLHLKYQGYQIHIGQLGDKEIDFVAEKNNERIYIQVAYLLQEQATIEREFGNLMQIKDNYPKYVISYDDYPNTNTYKGIQNLSLLQFLKSFNPDYELKQKI